MADVIPWRAVTPAGATYQFEGHEHGEIGVSFFLVDGSPGSGPALHRHPYAEVFVVQEGRATFTVAGATVEAVAGQIVVVPPGQPHKFVNSGDGPLRQVAIHANERMITEWLDEVGP